MQNRRRVAITGIGAVTPIGITVNGMWDGLRSERSAIRTVSRFDASAFRSHNAAEVRAFDPGDFLERKRAKRLDRFGHFSVACARLAIEDAGLDLDRGESRAHRRHDGVPRSAGSGSRRNSSGSSSRTASRTSSRSSRSTSSSARRAATSRSSSGSWGRTAPTRMSCASGTIGVGDAFRLIRDDYADVMLCGGAEAPLMPLCFGAFTIIRAMSTRNDDPDTRVAAVRQGTRRVRDGRGSDGARARGIRAGQGARGAHLRRGRWIRDLERRAPHDRAASRRVAGRARNAPRARRRDTSRRARSRT